MKKLLLDITKDIEAVKIKKAGDKISAPSYQIDNVTDAETPNSALVTVIMYQPMGEKTLDAFLKAVNKAYEADGYLYNLWGVRKSQSRVRGTKYIKHTLVLEYRGVKLNQEEL